MKKYSLILRPALLLLISVSAVCARADMVETEGMAPWETCALCHGLYGDSATSRFPKLAGQWPDYIRQQILRFKGGERTNDNGQMVSMVESLSTDDIEQVVGWFSSQKAPAPDAEPLSAVELAQLTSSLGSKPEQLCGACHSPQRIGSQSGGGDYLIPYIRSQHSAYLAKQLSDFKNGERMDPASHRLVRRLSEEDIALLARYFAGLERTADGTSSE